MLHTLYEINTIYRSYLENEDVKCLFGGKKKKENSFLESLKETSLPEQE